MIKKILPKKIRDISKSSEYKKVALGLSGGVDSSVAAFLLKEQGYEVTGVHIQCWDEKADGCSANEDRSYAVQAAASIGIKFVHLDFRKQYKDTVLQYFFDEYKAGRTPNPDVMCNKEIKFGLFYGWAIDNGFDRVATGHYARVENLNGIYKLLSGVDVSKDQSYFLYLLDQEHLAKTLFPLGNMYKLEVRSLALEKGIPTAKRPDSTGICFIGEIDVRMFLQKHIKPVKGQVVNKEGKIIGEHIGVWFYTIGQRHGFEIKTYQGSPMYVIEKDVKNNKLTVGSFEEAKKADLKVTDVHWVCENPLDNVSDIRCYTRIRHLGDLYPSRISRYRGEKLKVELDEKVFGIAVGQSAVFYDGDNVLGGGVIC